jgi:PAS domain S-box-containing protein
MPHGELPLYAVFQELIEQVIWIRDLHSGQVVYVSPAFQAVWGCPAAVLSADPNAWIETVHPEDRVQVLVAVPTQDSYPIDLEYRILRPDGEVRWIQARIFLLTSGTPASSQIVTIAQDITEQKKVELALRKALDRTQEQFALSRKMSLARKPGAVLKTLMTARELRSAKRAALLFFETAEREPVHGIESIITWQASQQLEPWERELALYEEPALWDVFRPNQPVQIQRVDQDDRLAPGVRDLLRSGKIASLAVFPMLALGKWIGVVLVYYHEEHAFDPVELRHLKVLVDQATITLYNLQLLEVEEDLRHEAEHANEIKTQFLAMMSHELRTPLTSILGFTTTLLAEDVAWEPEEQRDFIRTIRLEANRLQEMIDHLLDLSRLEAGMLRISTEPCSFRQIVEESLPQLCALATGQEVVLHLPASLPLVEVDAKRIAQVLTNLVQNARTYAPDGREIVISAAQHDRFVQVNVADQGPGFPPLERKSAFVAFRRGANQDQRPGKGAGLGLAICKRLIEAHGGRIWIKKQSIPGATLSFTLPVSAEEPVVVENHKAG